MNSNARLKFQDLECQVNFCKQIYSGKMWLIKKYGKEEKMAKRSKNSQAMHDRAVRKIANDFERKGYKVEADVDGFKQPGTISGYRPDVVAKKDGQRKLVEVETSESVNSARDQKQQQAFRNAANRSTTTTFRRTIVKTEN